MRFLVDENLPADLAYELRQFGHEATAIVDSSLRSSSDEVIWRFAADNACILITQDLDFPLSTSPQPKGLILVRYPGSFKVDTVLKQVSESLASLSEAELVGKITDIEPAGRTRARDL